MVAWWSDGSLSGMQRLLFQDKGYLVFGSDGAKFASQGSVDAGVITRKDYEAPCQQNLLRTVYANPRLRFKRNETTATSRRLTGVLTVVPASTFPADTIPTPSQIYASGNKNPTTAFTATYDGNRQHFRTRETGDGVGWVNSNPNSTTDIEIQPFIYGADYESLEPNTKYWAALIPVWIHQDNWGRDDFARTAWTVGNTDVVGRALSFWTSRTPTQPDYNNVIDNQLVASNSTIDLRITPKHPDAIAFSSTDEEKPWFRDLAGVQVQYSPKPSIDNPSPAWTDMPFVDFAGTQAAPTSVALGKGWWIDNAASNPTDKTAGAQVLRDNLVTKIRCGGNNQVVAANAGYGLLPSGDWRIRFRTFSYGTADASLFFGFSGPLASKRPEQYHEGPNHNDGPWTPNTYTANTYPMVHVSPWSRAIQMSITAQVPPPLIQYPINGAAVLGGAPIPLAWQYRNTATQAFPQASRTVQIRERGATAWTTLVSGNSSSPVYTIAADYGLVIGRAYEWRVKVTDSTGVESEYSEVGLFWVVPQPASGPTRPEVPDTIEGATLGLGKYRAYIYRRGGKRQVAEVTDIEQLDWGRSRDEISTAQVRVSGWDMDNGNMLARLKTWAYELVIFRDNGYTVDRVWEGPITLITYEVDRVTIDAKDVMAYAYRRIIKQIMNDNVSGDSVVSRAARILQNTLASDDPNVLAYLNPIVNAGDARQYRSLPAWSRTAYEEVDDMAANAGLDYTTVGRSILLWGTKYRIGTLPEMNDKHLGASPIVSEYGMSMANRYSVSDGNGIHGAAERLDDDGNDPVYGLVEMLSSTWAQDAQEDTGTYTQEGIATMIRSFEEHAERSIADRYPPPVVVRVPDNTSLHPETVLSIQQLVPGVVIPLRSAGTLRKVKANQKLDTVRVQMIKGVETITVSMSPFNRDDNDSGGEETA